MSYVLGPHARQALEDIYAHILPDDARAAERTIDRILQSCDTLARFPMIGRTGRVEGTREFSISNVRYFVVYEMNDDVVRVLDVIRTSRNWPYADPPGG